MSEPDVSELLTVAQAIKIIDDASITLRGVELSLALADGHVLAEDVVGDRDYPPFDKSLMDGFAVRCDDTSSASVELNVIGEIAAGQLAPHGIAPGETYAVMTGAPLPDGADGVVPVEDTQRSSAERVRILRPATPARFIGRRGSDSRAGEKLLPAGTRLGPAQIAVAASVGAHWVKVFPKPEVGVISTGDELVDIAATPGPAQIRNSNTAMLISLLARLGFEAKDLGVVRDDPALIRTAVKEGMRFNVLFISGGMSMGEHDHVPRILKELGVDLRITKLRVKPGKPFVFGVHRDPVDDPRDGMVNMFKPARYVFGLPGNPVSGFVCTLRLASRLLSRIAGSAPQERWTSATLTQSLPANGPREFYQPAVLSIDGTATPLAWKGSADVFTLARANALLVRAENEGPIEAGKIVRVLEIPS